MACLVWAAPASGQVARVSVSTAGVEANGAEHARRRSAATAASSPSRRRPAISSPATPTGSRHLPARPRHRRRRRLRRVRRGRHDAAQRRARRCPGRRRQHQPGHHARRPLRVLPVDGDDAGARRAAAASPRSIDSTALRAACSRSAAATAAPSPATVTRSRPRSATTASGWPSSPPPATGPASRSAATLADLPAVRPAQRPAAPDTGRDDAGPFVDPSVSPGGWLVVYRSVLAPPAAPVYRLETYERAGLFNRRSTTARTGPWHACRRRAARWSDRPLGRAPPGDRPGDGGRHRRAVDARRPGRRLAQRPLPALGRRHRHRLRSGAPRPLAFTVAGGAFDRRDRWLAVASDGAAIVGGDTNGVPDIFAVDLPDALDRDNDGMDDSWETLFQVTDPAADPDGDGATNAQEFDRRHRIRTGSCGASSPRARPARSSTPRSRWPTPTPRWRRPRC